MLGSLQNARGGRQVIVSATYNWTAMERNKDQFVGLIARPKEVNTLPFHYSYRQLHNRVIHRLYAQNRQSEPNRQCSHIRI